MCLRLYCKTNIYHNKKYSYKHTKCIKNKKVKTKKKLATYTHINRLIERYTSIIKYTLIYNKQG